MQEKYGRLTVISTFIGENSKGNPSKRAKCICDCGNSHEGCYYTIRRGKNLGCIDCSPSVKARSKDYKHRRSERFKKENPEEYRLHSVWLSMKARCSNEKNKSYHRYGGRGINVCDRWQNSFEFFMFDMGKPISNDHQIDRIDNDGNYEPSNCKWASRLENSRHKSSSRLLTIDGEAKCVSEWAEMSNTNIDTVLMRLSRGWDEKRAVFGNRYNRLYTTPDGEFKTLQEVQSFYDMSSSGVHSRFKSNSFANWIIKEEV